MLVVGKWWQENKNISVEWKALIDTMRINSAKLEDKFLGSISVSGQLPTYPSPNSTTVNWQQVRVNVGLGEG